MCHPHDLTIKRAQCFCNKTLWALPAIDCRLLAAKNTLEYHQEFWLQLGHSLLYEKGPSNYSRWTIQMPLSALTYILAIRYYETIDDSILLYGLCLWEWFLSDQQTEHNCEWVMIVEHDTLYGIGLSSYLIDLDLPCPLHRIHRGHLQGTFLRCQLWLLVCSG